MLWGLQPGPLLLTKTRSRQLNPPPQVSGKGNSRESRIPAGVRAEPGLPAAADLPQEATAWFRGGTQAGSERSGSRGRNLYLKSQRAVFPPFLPRRQPTATLDSVSRPTRRAHFRGAGLPATPTSPEPVFLCRPPLPDVSKAGPGCEKGGCSVF